MFTSLRVHAFLSALRLRHVLLVALVLRVIWFALCPNQPVSDQATYHRAASGLAAGLGYIEPDGTPANLWPVGYPALLGAAYWLFGAHYATAFALNILISLALVWGVAQLGSLLFGREAGLFAALLVAAHPTFVMHTTMLTSELPYATGAVWLMALCVRIARGELPWLWSAPLAGIGLGLLTYVRPTAQTFVLLLPIYALFWRRLRFGPAALASVAVALIAVLVLLPWGLRNRREFGVVALTSLNGGENLWMGNNPDSRGDYMEVPDEARALPLVARQHLLAQRGAEFIAQHPGRYLTLCLQRVGHTLRSDTIGAAWNEIGITRRFGTSAVVFFKVMCSSAHWLLLALAVFACVQRGRSHWRPEDAALGFMMLLLSAPFVLIVGGNRYMVPMLPLLCVWAASGVWLYASQPRADLPAADGMRAQLH
jgi:4-amino-4-deoxy-L-arabinose transferase-like glycosyltransferase